MPRPLSRRMVMAGLMGLLVALPIPASARDQQALVTAVPDGDTLIVRLLPQGTTDRVRLLGIDAPEVAHGEQGGQEPWGSRARQHLRQRVLSRQVRLALARPERDRYDRLLAWVYLQGQCLNLEMVRHGLALAYTREAKGPLPASIETAQRTARAKAIGIWQFDGGLKVLPGDFRRRQRDGDWDKPFRQ